LSLSTRGRAPACSAQHELKHEHAQQGDAGAAAHQLELMSLERVELTESAENTGAGEAMTAALQPIDGELNELAHDSVSMGRLSQSDKTVTNYDVL
jgi:hypothetical protein